MPTQCPVCKGSGFVKYEIKFCEGCNHYSRARDITTGLEKMPWDLCEHCYGDGEIENAKTEGDNKK
jgi:DnaJ-class molecular chaperone